MPVKRILVASLILMAAACSHGTTKPTTTHGVTALVVPPSGAIRVVTTISTLNSLVEGVGGDRVSVQSIVPVGASPETFQPAPQDVAKIADAQLLVENGAGLETWLQRMLSNAGNPSLRVVIGTAGLPVQNNNPHLWMDPQNAKHYVLEIRDGLIAIDPTHAAEYRKNAVRYNGQLDALTSMIQAKINSLPPSHRYMIVFHNAWLYYNDRFGITTLGFVERNPGQDPNPAQIARLINLAKAHHVRAVFSEPEYSPKLLYAIAQGAGVKVVDNLYDDSLGTDPRVSNYIAMLTYDTNQIVNALR
jgi:manganese/iron transport system substrate-binding protein